MVISFAPGLKFDQWKWTIDSEKSAYFKGDLIDISNYLSPRGVEGYAASQQISDCKFLFVDVLFSHSDGRQLEKDVKVYKMRKVLAVYWR